MKNLLVLILLLCGAALASCQCSQKPDVPPIDDASARAMIDSGVTSAHA